LALIYPAIPPPGEDKDWIKNTGTVDLTIHLQPAGGALAISSLKSSGVPISNSANTTGYSFVKFAKPEDLATALKVLKIPTDIADTVKHLGDEAVHKRETYSTGLNSETELLIKKMSSSPPHRVDASPVPFMFNPDSEVAITMRRIAAGQEPRIWADMAYQPPKVEKSRQV